jgi:hypothetical protein
MVTHEPVDDFEEWPAASDPLTRTIGRLATIMFTMARLKRTKLSPTKTRQAHNVGRIKT